jgi:hypothetical protein
VLNGNHARQITAKAEQGCHPGFTGFRFLSRLSPLLSLVVGRLISNVQVTVDAVHFFNDDVGFGFG